MEKTVEQSTAVTDTSKRIDTWNQPRSSKMLRQFIASRMSQIGDFDDEVELAAESYCAGR